jgi:hypothetical protein
VEHYRTKHPLQASQGPTAEAAAQWAAARPATKEYVTAEALRLSALHPTRLTAAAAAGRDGGKGGGGGGAGGRGFPAIAAFTMESPLYRLLNQTSRELKKEGGPEAFEVWPFVSGTLFCIPALLGLFLIPHNAARVLWLHAFRLLQSFTVSI